MTDLVFSDIMLLKLFSFIKEKSLKSHDASLKPGMLIKLFHLSDVPDQAMIHVLVN